MEIPIHHLDAFVTDGVFTGNPAAVCPLTAWLPDEVMQSRPLFRGKSSYLTAGRPPRP